MKEATKTRRAAPARMDDSPPSFPMAQVETKESAISAAGAKYQYPLEMASKTARINPRDERRVLDGALAELSMVPKLAAGSYYSIPRKKWDKEKGTFEVIKIEGPSIGAAMALARRWGNAINGSHIREELDDRLICEGVFIDAETNFWTFRTIAAEKFYTDKATKLKKPLAQDMLLNAIQAAQSKAVRNAILSGIPKWLTVAYFEEAKRIASGGTPIGAKAPAMTSEECMEWLVIHFPAMGVTSERLKEYIAENLKDFPLEEQVGELRGIYNALKDKQATVEEIFSKKNDSVEFGKQSGPVQGSMLGGS